MHLVYILMYSLQQHVMVGILYMFFCLTLHKKSIKMGPRHIRPFWDHQVAVVDVDEGVLEGSDMSGIHLNGFLVKNEA